MKLLKFLPAVLLFFGLFSAVAYSVWWFGFSKNIAGVVTSQSPISYVDNLSSFFNLYCSYYDNSTTQTVVVRNSDNMNMSFNATLDAVITDLPDDNCTMNTGDIWSSISPQSFVVESGKNQTVNVTFYCRAWSCPANISATVSINSTG